MLRTLALLVRCQGRVRPPTKKPKASFSRYGPDTQRLAGSNHDASQPLTLHHTSQQDDDLGKLQ